MTVQIQIGDTSPENVDLLQSLSEHQLMPALLKALVIDNAIADLTLTPEEEEIARTVLQTLHLLILDEATIALEYLAERQVRKNLTRVFQHRTVFFITHRLKSLQSADVILMMYQGKIVEQGTHDELMAMQSL